MDLGLTNATTVVVGGGRGMGLASARGLADDGPGIAIIARSRDDLDGATADLTDRGSPETRPNAKVSSCRRTPLPRRPWASPAPIRAG